MEGAIPPLHKCRGLLAQLRIMKKGLVLSGGGSKGAYEVGVLRHLLGDLQIKYDAIYGVSVGAINGGWISMYHHGQEIECINNLEDLWRSLETSTIYKDWIKLPWFLNYINYIIALFKPSIKNSKPLHKLVNDNFDQARMLSSGKKLRVGAVSLTTGEYKIFDENHPNIKDAILASSAYPASFIPVKVDGQMWLDGGIRQITPLKSAIDMGCSEIDVIITMPKNSLERFEKSNKLINNGPRILDIMSEEIMTEDISVSLYINNLIKQGIKIPGKKYIDIKIFRPEENLPGSSLEFDQKSIRKKIRIGYNDARRIIGNI